MPHYQCIVHDTLHDALIMRHKIIVCLIRIIGYVNFGRAQYTGLTIKLHVIIPWLSHTDNEIEVFYIKFWNTCTYSVYFKLKKELNYNRFVDPTILAAWRLVHSDLRIYRISFFLLDVYVINCRLQTSGFDV